MTACHLPWSNHAPQWLGIPAQDDMTAFRATLEQAAAVGVLHKDKFMRDGMDEVMWLRLWVR